ncbi:MAG: putative rane protein [Rhizorhabdus sp.]|nr:putative rane protein [Rhizorhabdus sp.]
MITSTLIAFTDWLGGTWLTALVAGHFWIVPALQTLHILAVAVVLSGVLLINLRVAGIVERGQPVAAVLDRFLRPVAVALAVLAITGILLIAGEPTRALFRVVFWTKMALIIAATALTWSHRPAFAGPVARLTGATPARKAVALLALLLWLAVIVAGRWIAYVEAWPGAPA